MHTREKKYEPYSGKIRSEKKILKVEKFKRHLEFVDIANGASELWTLQTHLQNLILHSEINL